MFCDKKQAELSAMDAFYCNVVGCIEQFYSYAK
jgi:hypothetical protein